MKVQFNKDFKGNINGAASGRRDWEQGDVDEVPSHIAEGWIDRGVCKPHYPNSNSKNKALSPTREVVVEDVEKRKFGWVYLIKSDGSEEKVGRGDKDYKEYKSKYNK